MTISNPENLGPVTREDWVARLLGLAIAAAIILCGWGLWSAATGDDHGPPQDDGVGELGKGFCADLRAGYTPFQILRSSVRDGTYTAEEAAARAFVWSERHCPEQLRSNEALRGYVSDFGHNPDG